MIALARIALVTTAAERVGLSRALGSSLAYWRSLRAAVLDPYRPELHYMRGRGPKWREKHAIKGAATPMT